MAPTIYDVIVVGTGAGGGMAMKTLCEAGLRVVALNSGRRVVPKKDFTAHTRPYEMKFRGFMDPKTGALEREGCLTESTQGRGIWEDEIGYTVAPGTKWRWARARGVGGKANFWGRSSARFGDIDYKAATLDGFDVDWPVTEAEMDPYYTRVEKYIGVASTVQNRPSNPDGHYLPPIKLRCQDYIMQKGAEKIGVPYLPDRVAQLTVRHGGRPACHYCGNCTSGCDTGAFFAPVWLTIPDAEKTGRLELRANAHVREVLVDGDGRARGVAYVDRETREEKEVLAKAIVLAASCCETTKIMLNSRSRHWPTGIANSSGQLGKNLSDHLYGGSAYGFLPQLVGQPSNPDWASQSTVVWMPRWQNLRNPREEKFIRGYSVYPGGGSTGFPTHYDQIKGFGSEYKKQIKRYYPAPMAFTIQAPSLPSPSNYIDIDPEQRDVYGIPMARFHFQWGPNELAMWEHSKQVCADVLKAAGGEFWGADGGADDEPKIPGTSLHETGPCRFGNDPKKFVTNRFSACHDVLNLYIGDASVFPFATDKTSTISIMAFTMRACEHMIEQLRTGEI